MELFEYQKKAANDGYLMPNHCLLCDCGIGKSVIELSIIRFRLLQEEIKNCLIIAPLSILWTAWESDIHKFYPDLQYSVMWHKDMTKRKLLLPDKGLCIINYDAVNKCFPELTWKNFDMIVLDESTKIKNTSKVCKRILALGRHAKFKTIMTATPGYKPEHYWSQMTFIGNTTKSKSEFLLDYCYRIPMGGNMSRYEPKANAIELMKPLLSINTIRLAKRDCLDLPEKTFIVREVMFDMKTYRQMIRDCVIEYEGETIMCEFPITLRQKLRQMADGVLYGEKHYRFHKAKLDELDHLINMIPGQIIIWTNYTLDAEEISKKYNTLTFNGQTTDKSKSYDDFNSGKNRIIVCHPMSAGHGITWVNCNVQIYYNLPDSLELFLQSQDRTHRIGQKNPCTYYILKAKGTVDEIVWNNLQCNRDFQQELLDYAREAFRVAKVTNGNVD